MASLPRRSNLKLIRCWKNQSGYATPPNITALAPLTATLAAAGAVGRQVADINPVGGTAPFTWSIAANPDAIKVGIDPDTGVILTQFDPVGSAAAHNLSIKAVDGYGKTLTNVVVVTLS